MTLCDTGPLIALIEAGDADHAACTAALPRLPGPLLTTWPCLTEAMPLLHRAGGHPAQDVLWGFVEDGLLRLHLSEEAEQRRMRAIMALYRNAPAGGRAMPSRKI